MKTLKLIFAILVSVSLITSCKKDKSEDPVPTVQKSQQELDLDYLVSQGTIYSSSNSYNSELNFEKNTLYYISGDIGGSVRADEVKFVNNEIHLYNGYGFMGVFGTYSIDRTNKKLTINSNIDSKTYIFILNK